MLERDTMPRRPIAGRDPGFEVTADAEAEWIRFHEEKSWPSHARWKDCTPSYFNQEGQADDQRILRNGGFGGSIIELRDVLEAWREEGMPGLTMSKEGSPCTR